LAEISGVRILITGDIEPDVQRQLERKFQLDGIEILKVPHHGSKFQDPAFLSEIDASIYLVSVGANSYGHPNPGLMAELGAGDSKVYRTDQSGAISLSWELSKELGRSIFSPRELGKGWWQIRWH
jgi:competence protein ComEC